jgi:hypothetical protein
MILPSCIKTEVINAPEKKEEIHYKPRKELVNTTDTTRKPIEFNPSVNDWDEQDINL